MRRTPARIALTLCCSCWASSSSPSSTPRTPTRASRGLSVSELTELVANVTTRNNQLREEIATLERQRDSVDAAVKRGDTSVGQIQADLDRILGWSGVLPVSGPGVIVRMTGPVPGDAIELLMNELRNAGAEATAIGDVRVVPGVVASGPEDAVVLRAFRSRTRSSSAPWASRRSSRARSAAPAGRSRS